MSMAIVDASVGIKWYVPEVHTPEAHQWLNGPDELHTLSVFFDIEIANILWKKVRQAEITQAQAEAVIAQLQTVPMIRHPEPVLLGAALDLAVRIQRTVYDCLYLALAMQLSGYMVTADQRFFNSLAGTPWASYVCWIANVPSAP